MDQLRIPQAQLATLTAGFAVAGVPADLDTIPQVAVLGEDGTAISSGAATHLGPGSYSYDLTPTDTAALNVLAVTWSAQRDGVEQTVLRQLVHVVGDHYFTLSALRGLDPLEDDTKYPDAKLAAWRDTAEAFLEHRCSVAFVPRYGHDRLTGTGNERLMLDNPLPLGIDRILIDGDELLPDDLGAIVTSRWGTMLRRGFGWPYYGNVEVFYTHGYRAPPGDIVHAAMLLARHELTSNRQDGIPDRATSLTTGAGDFRLITPGVGGQPTAIPEVNAAIQAYDLSA